MVVLFSFKVLRTLHAVFQSGCANIYSQQQCRTVPVLHILTDTSYLLSFDDSHLAGVRWCLIVVLICIFLMTSWCWAPFRMCVGHLNVFLWKNVTSHFLPILKSECFFVFVFEMSCLSCIYIIFYIWVLVPFRYMTCKYCLPFGRLPFHSVGFLCCAELFSLK